MRRSECSVPIPSAVQGLLRRSPAATVALAEARQPARRNHAPPERHRLSTLDGGMRDAGEVECRRSLSGGCRSALFFSPFFYGEPLAEGHASGHSGCDHARRCGSMRHTLRCRIQTAGESQRRRRVRDLPSVAATKLPGCRGQMAAHADAAGGRPSPRGVHADAVLRADHGRARRSARVNAMSGPERTGFGPRFRWRRFETLRHFITFPLSTCLAVNEMVNVIPSNGGTAGPSW